MESVGGVVCPRVVTQDSTKYVVIGFVTSTRPSDDSVMKGHPEHAGKSLRWSSLCKVQNDTLYWYRMACEIDWRGRGQVAAWLHGVRVLDDETGENCTRRSLTCKRRRDKQLRIILLQTGTIYRRSYSLTDPLVVL